MGIIEYGTSWLLEDQLNIELLNEIKNFIENNLEFLHKDKTGYSTKGNNAEQYWIKKGGKNEFQYSNQEYENIKQKFRKKVYERLEKASILRKEEIELGENSVWTVIGEEGSYHTTHTHSNYITGGMGGITTVLYLNVPKSDSDDKSNSIFLVLHTDPPSNFIISPCPHIIHIKPKIGKLLIFPNHIPHGTYPQTKGIRQTFNVDYHFNIKSKSNSKKHNFNYQ